MTVLGIDIGYGYVKGISSDMQVKPVLTKSLVGSGKELTLKGGLFGSNPDDLQVNIVEDGQKRTYFVGDLARRESPDAAYTMDENKIDHQNTKVLLATACASLWPIQGSVHLVTGLPMSHYKGQRKAFEESLKKIDMEVTLVGKRDPIRVKFDTVTVFLQGYGAAYASLLSDKGEAKDKTKLNHGGLLVVVDPGQKTTEVITFETYPQFRPVENLSFGFNMGGDDVVRAMKRIFESKTGSPLPDGSTDQFVQNGQMWHYGAQVDAKADLEEIRADIGRAIFERIKAGLGDSLSRVHTVSLAGGNYTLIEPFFTNQFANTEIVPDPQFANARGYKIVGEILERKYLEQRAAERKPTFSRA